MLKQLDLDILIDRLDKDYLVNHWLMLMGKEEFEMLRQLIDEIDKSIYKD